MVTERRQRETEKLKRPKSVKSDVDAIKFDGEALIGAADTLNGDMNAR